MPNVSFPSGGLSGDPTVATVLDCQAMCDELPACQTWTAFSVTNRKNWRCTMKAATVLAGAWSGTPMDPMPVPI